MKALHYEPETRLATVYESDLRALQDIALSYLSELKVQLWNLRTKPKPANTTATEQRLKESDLETRIEAIEMKLKINN